MQAAKLPAMRRRLAGVASRQAMLPRSMGRTSMRLTIIMTSNSGIQVNKKP